MGTPATKLLKLIQNHQLRVFTTADLLTLTGMKPPAATQALRRLAAQGLIMRIKRGTWVNQLPGNVHPYEAVAYLNAPWPAYISLYSALADYGVVEEIPQIIYAVSSNKPKRYETHLGSFHIHHLPERLLWGYEIRTVGRASYPIAAEPEKAFLDLVYLALIPRSSLQLPHKREARWNLDRIRLKKYAARFKFQPMMDWLKRQDLR